MIVKVNSMDKTSRWYPGAGLYRPVRLIACQENHFTYSSIWAKAKYDLLRKTAKLDISCTVNGNGEISHTVFAPDGTFVKTVEGKNASTELDSPVEWSTEDPKLYTLMSELTVNGEIVDRVFTRFGVRTAAFDKNAGFFLNGRLMKIQGVCMHHDLGMLGVAYREDVVRKRFETLKEMGCNALRTTHNPPCPTTLDICDELGILVLDEAFDEWLTPKAVNGYANEFPVWAERDLVDMIRRDRNHPSVILYSIGNEIPDQTAPEGGKICKWLVDICHREDETRPVTCGINRIETAKKNGLTDVLDVIGLNYLAQDYERLHKENPNWIMIGTEVMSAVSSRCEYYLPAQIEMPVVKRENLHVNSFDYSAVACAYIPDIEFEAQRNAPFVAGQFVWTGYDYLGEPTPYRSEWPSRSSYFGIIDLAGLKKDRYYAFAAEWTKKPVLHLFPHWNWEEGQLVDVHCYTNLDHVYLYVNGKEHEIQERKNHRIIFKDVVFEPGEIRAKGYGKDSSGKEIVIEDVRYTAGEPSQLRIICDETVLTAGSEKVCFAEVHVLDQYGHICPNADNRIDIQVEGAGEYIASDAGDQTSLRSFNLPYCEAFHGKIVLTLKPGVKSGKALIKVSAKGLKADAFMLDVRA